MRKRTWERTAEAAALRGKGREFSQGPRLSWGRGFACIFLPGARMRARLSLKKDSRGECNWEDRARKEEARQRAIRSAMFLKWSSKAAAGRRHLKGKFYVLISATARYWERFFFPNETVRIGSYVKY